MLFYINCAECREEREQSKLAVVRIIILSTGLGAMLITV